MVARLPGGGVEFTEMLVNPSQNQHGTMREQFTPARNSIRWHVRITGKGGPWSTRIDTAVAWPLYAGAGNTYTWWRNRNGISDVLDIFIGPAGGLISRWLGGVFSPPDWT